MNASSAPLQSASEAVKPRTYLTKTYRTEVRGPLLHVRRTTWRGLQEEIFEEKIGHYRAVAMAREDRFDSWFDRMPQAYAQVVLVHKFDRERDVILWEAPSGHFDADIATPAQRRAWESLSVAFNLPAIKHVDASSSWTATGPAPAHEVFNARRPEELSWGIREFAARGRISVARNVPEPPPGVRISRSGTGMRIDFRYSSLRELWRGLRVLLALALFSLGARRMHGGPTWGVIKFLLAVFAIVIFCFCLVVVPILHFMNGSTMEVDDKRLVYRPGQGATIFPSVKWEYSVPLEKIEAIRNRGFHVLLETDTEVVQVLCSGPGAARWFELALMAVAAHGPSVLADKIEPAVQA